MRVTPSRILVTRHVEKPGDPMNPELSATGDVRAERLADYIPATVGRPEFLFATTFSTHSARPIETPTPLSKQIGVAIDATFAGQDDGTVAEEAPSQPSGHCAVKSRIV